jgi:hypothetical protein
VYSAEGFKKGALSDRALERVVIEGFHQEGCEARVKNPDSLAQKWYRKFRKVFVELFGAESAELLIPRIFINDVARTIKRLIEKGTLRRDTPDIITLRVA